MNRRISPALIALIVVVAVLLISVSWYVSTRNDLVRLEQDLEGQWAQVENQLQRRYDLIPNLVETVKGFASQESEIFIQIAEARSKLAGAQGVSETAQASGELDSALSRLLVVVENYPQLKSDANFMSLQDELAGTENRLAVARMNYNDAVRAFNTAIRVFPGSVVAGSMGLEKQDYFEIEQEARTAPKVSFD
ncbi:MAG: LemA family protein [Spirochaetia bacterium]|nr:LemA family protein [Spirochaetia bacterium]